MAPSPTGWLHMGTARAALFNYLFTRREEGIFILRIEDTDRERSRKEFEDDIIEQLTWLGLSWDEFYQQSERTNFYTTSIEQLLRAGKAFYCTHSKDELEAEHAAQVKKKEPPRHVCSDRNEGREEGIIRLKNDTQGNLSFTDLIRGTISFQAELLGDFSLARGVEIPLYNFSAVVDDYEMRISHVIRGEDHIPNTPKQLLIQQAFGWEPPQYAHLPLLLGADRSKLSKRHGATAVRDYRTAGYLPVAVINFLALLGWNPGDDRELFILRELEKEFSLEKVQKAGAVFNEEKLEWLNRIYIKKMSIDDLMQHAAPFVSERGISSDTLQRVLEVEKPRITKLSDIMDTIPLYTEDPAYDKKLLSWKGQDLEHTREHLARAREILCDIDEDTFARMELLQQALDSYAATHGKGNVLWPLRAALSGKEASPGPFEIMFVIGKEATLQRIDNALKLLHGNTYKV